MYWTATIEISREKCFCVKDAEETKHYLCVPDVRNNGTAVKNVKKLLGTITQNRVWCEFESSVIMLYIPLTLTIKKFFILSFFVITSQILN